MLRCKAETFLLQSRKSVPSESSDEAIYSGIETEIDAIETKVLLHLLC